jgi:hypothetical protein
LFSIIAASQELEATLPTALDPRLAIKLKFVTLLGSNYVSTAVETVRTQPAEAPSAKVEVPTVTSVNTQSASPAAKTQPKAQVPPQPTADVRTQEAPAATEITIKVAPAAAGSAIDSAMLAISIKQQHPRVAAMVAQGRLVLGESGKHYQLLLPYKFHLQRLEQLKTKQMLVNILNQLAGSEVNLELAIDDGLKSAKPTAAKTGAGQPESNEKLVEDIFSDII